MITSKRGYDPIPDVEIGGSRLSAKERYPGLDDEQIDLLNTLDSAIANSTRLDFGFPAVNPKDVVSQRRSYVAELGVPTATVICTALVALFLEATTRTPSREEGSLSLCLIQLFPYANATIVSISIFASIERCLVAALEPVLARISSIQDESVECVVEVVTNVYLTVDSIQHKINTVMEPIKPIIEFALNQGSAFKEEHPYLAIPDQKAVDRELDEAMEIVGKDIDEAHRDVDISKFIPRLLQSTRTFHWSVVFPTFVFVLLVQIITTFATVDCPLTCFEKETNGTHYQAADRHVNASNVGVMLLAENEIGSSILHGANEKLENIFIRSKDWISTQDFGSYQKQASLLLTDSSSMLSSIAISYFIAVVQVAVVYLLSCNAIIAWYSSRALAKASEDVSRVLRVHGVSHVLEDVLGTRMVRVRKKVLKIIAFSKEVEVIIDKIDGERQSSIKNGTNRSLRNIFGFGR